MTFNTEVLPGGVGAKILPSTLNDDLGALSGSMLDAAMRHGYALIQGVALNKSSFKELIGHMGATADHYFGTGSAELFELNADPDPGKMVAGRTSLPLHTDGALVKTHPSYIVLYCHKYDQPLGSGETQICDQGLVFKNMPDRLRSLFDVPWEYMVYDSSHFPTIAGKWISIDPIIKKNGIPTLNLAMPFKCDEPNPAWSVRLSNKDASTSAELFSELDGYLRSSDRYYSHRWQTGDLLVINNSKVMHGRSAIIGGGERHLFRGQLA
jgi:alpha-ketoglutarate-dependent taurine dioxygenase